MWPYGERRLIDVRIMVSIGRNTYLQRISNTRLSSQDVSVNFV